MPFQAWIPAFADFFAMQNASFNGAMPFQAWIWRGGLGWIQHTDTASMGPCPFRHGYADRTVLSVTAYWLQWGHALSGMDMASETAQTTLQKEASMGPCPFRHGYMTLGIGSAVEGKLQWGHALSGMDIGRYAQHTPAQHTLQWGHALSGMDMKAILSGLVRMKCFNGAMPFQAWISLQRHITRPVIVALQWGHALSGMDMSSSSSSSSNPGFNGAMPFQAWIFLILDRETDHRRRFNGAMPFQAWIYRDCRLLVEISESFNGAMPFQAWIFHLPHRGRRARTPLQWGHALSGMDMWIQFAGEQFGLPLQWGHALSGMDISTML